MYVEQAELAQFLSNEDLSSLLQLDRVDLRLPSFKVSHRERKPLFFYHIPKTAGLTFRNSLSSSMKFADKHWQTSYFSDLKEEIFSWNENYSDSWMQAKHSLVSAWRPFGFHRRFNQDFNLVTVFREPFARVVSRFRYKCYFGEFECTDAGFRQFFTLEKNRNHQTKLVSGVGDARGLTTDDLILAKTNLREFFAYCVIDEVDELLSELLSLYGLPNVVGQRNNVSLAQYSLNWQQFKQEVLALNSLDVELYEHVVANPKRPDIDYDRSQVSAIVNLTRERDANNVFRCVCHEVIKLNQQIDALKRQAQVK